MPQNYRSHEFHEKNYLSRRIVIKIFFLSVKTYKICPPHPVHHSGVMLYMYDRIYLYNIHQKERQYCRKLNCQVINYCAPGHTGNLRQKQEFSISGPVHCCKGKK